MEALLGPPTTTELTPRERTALDRLTGSGGLDRETALEMIVSSRAVPDGVEAQSSRPAPARLPAPGVALTDEEVKRAMHLEHREGIPFWQSRARVRAERGRRVAA